MSAEKQEKIKQAEKEILDRVEGALGKYFDEINHGARLKEPQWSVLMDIAVSGKERGQVQHGSIHARYHAIKRKMQEFAKPPYLQGSSEERLMTALDKHYQNYIDAFNKIRGENTSSAEDQENIKAMEESVKARVQEDQKRAQEAQIKIQEEREVQEKAFNEGQAKLRAPLDEEISENNKKVSTLDSQITTLEKYLEEIGKIERSLKNEREAPEYAEATNNMGVALYNFIDAARKQVKKEVKRFWDFLPGGDERYARRLEKDGRMKLIDDANKFLATRVEGSERFNIDECRAKIEEISKKVKFDLGTVRHPFSRALSAFEDFLKQNAPQKDISTSQFDKNKETVTEKITSLKKEVKALEEKNKGLEKEKEKYSDAKIEAPSVVPPVVPPAPGHSER